MRILMSGGMKTQNIVSAIHKKFEASGDEFVVVEFLDDINAIYAKGDYFDKAIITEQSITREYSIKDEMQIRQRINSFANESKSKGRKISYVFLTQEETIANMMYEEILPIMSQSVVVYHKPPYYATFFTQIIVNDVKQLPKDLVYQPEDIVSNTFNNDINDTIDDIGISDDELSGTNSGYSALDNNFDIFGGEEISGHVEGLGTDDGEIFDTGDGEVFDTEDGDIFDTGDGEIFGTEEDGTFDTTDDGTFDSTAEDTFSNDFLGDGSDAFQDADDNLSNNMMGDTDNMDNWGNNQEFGGDDYNIDPDQYQGARSGELPNYVNDQYQDPNSYNQYQQDPNNFEQYQQDMSSNKLEGFDEDDYGGDVSDNSDMYGDYTPNNFDVDGYQPATMNGNQIPVAGYDQNDPYSNGFNGDDLYDNGTQANPQGYNPIENQQQINMNTGMGMGNNMDMQNQYQQMPEQETSPGFGAQDYERTVPGGLAARKINQAAQQVGRKKRGNMRNIQNNQANMQNQAPMGAPAGHKNVNKVKDVLKPFASRGNSIVVTGCGGCGTSTIAFNLANIICQLGYTVLLVDMDIEGRSQCYISKNNYDSMDVEGANLMAAVNSSANMASQAAVVKPGFHLLTMGLATDSNPIEEVLHKEKVARFASVVKTNYNFIIYDIPFRHAVNFLSDITYTCENLVLTVDASNWGVTKAMLNICNVDSDDMQDVLFTKTQIVFNKYRNLNRLFGLRVKTCADITAAMDRKVVELIGDDIGLEFSKMSIAGIVNDDPMFENGWYEDVQYSDTKKGQELFMDLIESIVLVKH